MSNRRMERELKLRVKQEILVQHFEWFFKTGRNDKQMGFCGALTTLSSSSLWTVKSLSLQSQLKEIILCIKDFLWHWCLLFILWTGLSNEVGLGLEFKLTEGEENVSIPIEFKAILNKDILTLRYTKIDEFTYVHRIDWSSLSVNKEKESIN